ncbi:MAG: hypothetical protein JXB48_12005, partial [Candidatus Latescibacteria bacterium]|nr:hypothetical protein [Candidatus Latescibacterota bacterium]
MKKFRLVFLLWLSIIVISSLFSPHIRQISANDFLPNMLRMSAPAMVTYDFCDPDMEFPVRIIGTNAIVIFSVFTHDKAQDINNIRNGYLGWHYVNHIDTCMYVSPPYEFTPGDHVIIWNGRTPSGSRVRRGEYTYYLWGYDYTDMGQLVSRSMNLTKPGGIIKTRDYEGYPLEHPVFYNGVDTYHMEAEPVDVVRSKWIIGRDPFDSSLIETTSYPGWIERGSIAL